MTVLLLGGTGEARALASRLGGDGGLRVVHSRAGRVQDTDEAPSGVPDPDDGAPEVRTGGFGGATGLAVWLRTHAPVAVVDATHPYAPRISQHAVAACAEVGVPLLRVERPGWTEGPGDRWHRVPDLASAAARVPDLGSRPFVTTGRQDLGEVVGHPALAGLTVLARCVEAPEGSALPDAGADDHAGDDDASGPAPPDVRLLLDRGPYAVADERALMRKHHVDVLVTKDSGGDATRAKLDAARELGVAVVVVERPPPPPTGPGVTVVTGVDEAEAWVRARSARPPGAGDPR